MQAPAAWDAVAPTYAEDLAQWDDFARRALELVPVTAGRRVLDLACGPGTLALLAARAGASVEAIDFSPAMVAQVTGRAARAAETRIHAAVMDAQALAFDDATFDAAYCLFSFFLFPNRPRVLAEIRRVLKPGGRLLIATWGPIERRPVMQIVFDAVAEALPELPRPAKGELQHPDECSRELAAAGFRDVATHVMAAWSRFDSAEDYVDTMLRSGPPFALLKKRLGEEAWRAARERVLEGVRRRFPGPRADLAAEAILTWGTR